MLPSSSSTKHNRSVFCSINICRVTYTLQDQSIVDQATNAQIDTLILDNRKKLNQIIGTSRLIE